MGHVAAAARPPDTTVPVRTAEFLSSVDGQEFIRRLEALPSEILRRLPPGQQIPPSQVDHLLAVIRRDRTATVYVNELQITSVARASRDVQAGELLAKNDIMDIMSMHLGGVAIPDDAGVAWVFSVGWRKGYFYDLGPLAQGGGPRRAYDLCAAFAQMYAHVLFQERFSILQSEWEAFFRSQWFPFAGLRHDTVEGMLRHLRSGWALDDLTDAIVREVRDRLPSFLALWRRQPVFAGHTEILERAAERFAAGDYISCTGLVFPRIEGIMRSHYAAVGCTARVNQAGLCAAAVRASADRARSLLLPQMFERYLDEVYFADFDPTAATIGVSRHSVGHGVAHPADFSAKAAVIGLLVVQQLCYSFEAPAREEGEAGAAPGAIEAAQT
jgi:hypothetical protein